MAIVYATKTGNWSDTTVWNTGALPTSADDVYANTFTVTVNVSATVLTIRTTSASGISQGGLFDAVNGITLTCTSSIGVVIPSGVYIDGLRCNLPAGQSFTLNANLVGAGGNSSGVVYNNSTGTLNIIGTITSLTYTGGNGCNAVYNYSSGTINITGSCNGSGANGSGAVSNNSNGTINLIGSCVGGSVSGIINLSTGTVVITGTVTSAGSATGVINNSAGTINITGTATGGTSTGNAFVNNSTGTITHIGTAQASATAPAIGAGVVGQTTILTGPLLSTDASYAGGATASGVNPCIALRWFPKDTALSTFNYRMKAQTVVGIRSDRDLYLTNAYSSSYPLTSNVRRSTTYGPTGIYTGTCYIPDPQTVGYGVGVGSTTGTAVFFTIDSLWGVPISSLTVPGSIGERLKNAATTSSVAQVLKDAYR
jgi:hypothetical protein